MSGSRAFETRSTDGVILRGDRWGSPDAPAVVLGHGGGQTRHAWGGAARAIASAGYEAITFDLRGHGDSDWAVPPRYDDEAFVQDLASVLATCRGPAVVVGASLSGLSGLLLAGAARPRLRGLVLVDVTPTLDPDGIERIVGFMRERLDEGFASIEEAGAAIAAYLPHRPAPRDLSGLGRNLRRGDDGRYRWHWDPEFIRAARSVDLEAHRRLVVDAARAIDVPTLLVRGRMSELVTDAAVAEFRELVPHASFRDVGGAGHMVAGDRNDAFIGCVLEFLEDLGTRAMECATPR